MVGVEIELHNPWDFEEVYAYLHDFARGYAFQPERDYLIHITTGTHVAQICWFLLAEARYLPPVDTIFTTAQKSGPIIRRSDDYRSRFKPL